MILKALTLGTFLALVAVLIARAASRAVADALAASLHQHRK
ncbi:MAG: hypothetical protein ACE5H9_21620 [Anaerolineae bacterium]